VAQDPLRSFGVGAVNDTARDPRYTRYKSFRNEGLSHEDAMRRLDAPEVDQTKYAEYARIRRAGASHDDAYKQASERVAEERRFMEQAPTSSRFRAAGTRAIVQALADYGPGLAGRAMQGLGRIRDIARPPMVEGEEREPDWRDRLASALTAVPEKTREFLGQFEPMEPGAPEVAGTVAGRLAVDVPAAFGIAGAARAAPVVGPALTQLSQAGRAGRAASTIIPNIPVDVAQSQVYGEGLFLPGEKGALAENLAITGAAAILPEAIGGTAEYLTRRRPRQAAAAFRERVARSEAAADTREAAERAARQPIPPERRLPAVAGREMQRQYPPGATRDPLIPYRYDLPIGPRPKDAIWLGPAGSTSPVARALEEPVETVRRLPTVARAAEEPVEEVRRLPMAGREAPEPVRPVEPEQPIEPMQRVGERERLTLDPNAPEPVREVRKSPLPWERPGAVEADMPAGEMRSMFTSVARSPDGSVQVPVIYRVVEADDIVPSNDPFTFAPNPEYPSGVQGRGRQYETGPTQGIVVQYAADLRPANLLDPTNSMADGPPIVSPNGIVVTGNNRTMSLQRAIEEFPGRYQDYSDQLKALVREGRVLGVNGEDIAGISRPVLVREIQPEGGVMTVGQMADINRASDVSATKAMRVEDMAANKASAMRGDEEIMNFLSERISADETLTSFLERADGRQFLDLLVQKGVLNTSELPALLTNAGRLNQNGKGVIRKMVLASAFDDFEDYSDAILRKMEIISPQVSAIRGLEGDMADVMNRAALALREASDNKMTVEDLAKQSSVFGEAALPENVVNMARYIRDNTQNKIKEDIREYASYLLSSRRAAAEGPGLFGEEVAEQLTESPRQVARRIGIEGLYSFPGPAFQAIKTEAGQQVAGGVLGAVAGAEIGEERPISSAVLGGLVGMRAPGLVRGSIAGGRSAVSALRQPETRQAVAEAAKVRVSNLISGAPVARGERARKKAESIYGSNFASLFDRYQSLLDLALDQGGPKAAARLQEKFGQLDSSQQRAVGEMLKDYGSWFQANKNNLEEISKAAVIRADYANRSKIAPEGADLAEEGFKLSGYSNERLREAYAEVMSNPYLVQATDELQGMFRDILRARARAGIISADELKRIEESVDYYAPLLKDFSEITQFGGETGRGLGLVPGKGVKGMDRTLSRTGPIQDPLEVLVGSRMALERDVARQSIMDSLFQLMGNADGIEGVIRVLPPGSKKQSGARVFTTSVGGERRTVEVLDPAIWDAVEANRAYAGEIFRAVADAKRAGITLPPDFSVLSLMRDLQIYAVQQPKKEVLRGSRAGALVGGLAGYALGGTKGAIAGAGVGSGIGGLTRSAYEIAEGLAHGLVKSDEYMDFIRAGGSTAGMAVTDPKDLAKLVQTLSEGELRSIVNFRNPLEAAKIIGEAAETAPRFATYKKTKSAWAAQNITLPFSRIGSSKELQRIASATPFWNAMLRGWVKTGQLLSKGTRGNTTAIGAATITAPTLSLWLINKDNPEYWERPLWERNMFWFVPKSLVDGEDATGFYRFPKGFEVGLLYGSIPERIFDALARSGVIPSAAPEGSSVEDEIIDTALTFLRNNVSGTVPIPAAVQPIIESATNYDLFRGRQITPDYIRQRDPELQYRESTSALGRLLGRLQPVMTPIEFDQTVRSLFGTSGERVLDLTDILAEEAGMRGPFTARTTTQRLGDIAGLGRFQSTEYSVSQPEYDAMSILEEAEKAASGVRQLEREGVPRENIVSYARRNSKDLMLYEATEEERKVFEELRTLRNQVISSRDLSPEQKQQQLRRISSAGVEVAESVFRKSRDIK